MIRAADESEEKNKQRLDWGTKPDNWTYMDGYFEFKSIVNNKQHGRLILTAKNKWIQLAIAAEELTPRRCQVLELARASS